MMINTIVKIIKSYWDMDIKPFMKVMSKTTTSSNHIKKWDTSRDRDTFERDTSNDEDIEIHGNNWEDWEMTEMPHVSDTSNDTSNEIKRFLGHLNEKEE